MDLKLSKKERKYKIAVIGGDGIGPEVIFETVRLLKATGLKFEFFEAEAGFSAYQKYSTPLPKKTIEICKKSDAILFGACTTPPFIKNYFSPIVKLRKIFDLYANLRPFFSLPIPNQKKNIDFIIIRENTEDLYVGKEIKTKEGAISQRVITKRGCRRIVRFAFEFAKKKKRKKITFVHKANILRLTDGLFLKIAKEISKKYKGIEFEEKLVDSCSYFLVKNPENFDVICTTNMFGDILSDTAAALVGGLGVCPSANIGKKYKLFEPVHGSAPDLAGKGRANPLGSFFSAVICLEFLGEEKVAQKIKKAIFSTLKRGIFTPDLGGKVKTKEFTDEVIKSLQNDSR